MDKILRKALYVIATSLGLAFLFNFLFFGKLIGISVVIFTIVALGAVYVLGMHYQLPFKKAWWIAVPILFFAIMPSIRANPLLTFFNICAILGLLMVLTQELTGIPAIIMKLRDYSILAILVPLRMIGRAFSTLSLVGQIHSKVENRDVWIRIFKGVLMAVPILIIFAVLFSQADLVFSQFVKGFVNINISLRTIQYLMVLGIVFVAAMGFLSYIFFPKNYASLLPGHQADASIQPGRGVEVLVFLGLISVLFLLFIGFQITYLFGGEANIVNAGFTYAEYARRGFWELLAVAMLSLIVLLAAEKYARVETKSDKKFLIPALVLIGEVIVVIISAFKRLSLYIDAYGQTMLRFYVASFIILLLVLFIVLAYKFIKSKPEQFFTFGTLLSLIIFLMTLNIINPDAFIAASNIKQFNRTGKVDALYMRELSTDAETQKIELYNSLRGSEKEDLEMLLLTEKYKLQDFSTHWQSSNLSRSRALKLLQELRK